LLLVLTLYDIDWHGCAGRLPRVCTWNCRFLGLALTLGTAIFSRPGWRL